MLRPRWSKGVRKQIEKDATVVAEQEKSFRRSGSIREILPPKRLGEDRTIDETTPAIVAQREKFAHCCSQALNKK